MVVLVAMAPSLPLCHQDKASNRLGKCTYANIVGFFTLPKISFPYLCPASFQPVMLEIFVFLFLLFSFSFLYFFDFNTVSLSLSALVKLQVTMLHKIALIVLVFQAKEEPYC